MENAEKQVQEKDEMLDLKISRLRRRSLMSNLILMRKARAAYDQQAKAMIAAAADSMVADNEVRKQICLAPKEINFTQLYAHIFEATAADFSLNKHDENFVNAVDHPKIADLVNEFIGKLEEKNPSMLFNGFIDLLEEDAGDIANPDEVEDDAFKTEEAQAFQLPPEKVDTSGSAVQLNVPVTILETNYTVEVAATNADPTDVPVCGVDETMQRPGDALDRLERRPVPDPKIGGHSIRHEGDEKAGQPSLTVAQVAFADFPVGALEGDGFLDFGLRAHIFENGKWERRPGSDQFMIEDAMERGLLVLGYPVKEDQPLTPPSSRIADDADV